MNALRCTRGLVVLLVATLWLAPAVAVAYLYVEDFTTTDYLDPLNTTADWNTDDGEVRLFPFEPSIVGSADTPSEATGIAIAGNHAYIADGGGGLQVVDITDPTAPVIVGSCDTDGLALDVAVDGNTACVAMRWSGLLVVDVTDPTNPTPLGSYDTPGSGLGVAIAGNHAYVADLDAGLQVIDISDPTNPTLAGNYDHFGSAIDVAVAGNRAYLANLTVGLLVIDITDPTDPEYLSTCDTPDDAWCVALAGDHAYVADWDSGLQVIDITDTSAPILVGSCDTPGRAYGVAIAGNYAYVADDYASGLLVLDITDPAAPSLVASIDTPGGSRAVAVAGDRAFVADNDHGLQVIDIAEPVLPPIQIGRYTGEAVMDVTVAGDRAYLASSSAGLRVLDISDPSEPVSIGSLGSSWGEFLSIEGDLAYLSRGRLHVIDISDPTSPTEIGSINVTDGPERISVAGDHAYVPVWLWSGVHVVDIRDPTTPVAVGFYEVDYCYDVAVAGDHAYVVTATRGLHVLDITDPMDPVQVGHCDAYHASAIALEGDYACVARDGIDLRIIDISDPTAPVTIGRCDKTPYSRDVALAGDYLFVAASYRGFHMIDISDPAAPTLIGRCDMLDVAWSVAVAGDHAFVADHNAGLPVIEVFQRRFDTHANVARSLVVDGIDETIGRARVTAERSDSVTWELSADGGANWQKFPADGVWRDFTHPGVDLLWRSTHEYPGNGANPTCGRLEIEYETATTPVEGSFYAVLTEDEIVTLRWTVASLAGIEGFDVYRATSPDGPYRKVNQTLLPASSPGSFEDWTIWPETTFWYELRAVMGDGGEDVMEGSPVAVTTDGKLASALRAPSPNPFTTETAIEFDVPNHVGAVALTIYNVRGQRVAELASGSLDRGRHTARWDGTTSTGEQVPSGVYFVRLEAGSPASRFPPASTSCGLRLGARSRRRSSCSCANRVNAVAFERRPPWQCRGGRGVQVAAVRALCDVAPAGRPVRVLPSGRPSLPGTALSPSRGADRRGEPDQRALQR